ncbi:MAG: hypothetical protein KFB93_01620 [Simkaniaceae bacterium]|nr:MAG: hypothetical protein KFB93_01620 [Simkaniaceae bacterium]
MRSKTPHKAIQKAIKIILPEVILEKSFPEICRIADIAYLQEKIIFEIQYSPITLLEVRKRNQDYASIGFTVIWILHDHTFNKKTLTPAELYLRKNLSYYTSITPYGHGFFYDQLEFFQGNQRVYKGKPHTLKNFLPKSPTKIPRKLPKSLKEKLSKAPLYLSGDLSDLLMDPKELKRAKELEKTFCPTPTLKTVIIKIFEYLLKRSAGPRRSSSLHNP